MPVLCRDCLSGANPSGVTGCVACGSVRLVVHDELERLTIAHLDCDAFYAAVEKRDDPALADKPVIVGGGKRGAIDLTWYHGPQGMKAMSDRLQPQLGKDTNIGKWGIGVAFVGDEGIVVSDYGKIVHSPGEKFKDYKRPEPSIPKSAGHHKEWIKACKGEGETLCNFEYSGALIEHNLLGNVAHRAGVGKAFDWDAKAFAITNDEAANKLLSKTYREGWEI